MAVQEEALTARTAIRPAPLTGLAFIAVSASSFALQGIFARLAYAHHASPPTVGLGRFGLAAATLWAYSSWRNRRGEFQLLLPHRVIFTLLLLGGLVYFLGSLAYLAAVQYIPVSLAGLLLYTYPAIATLLAVWLGREHLSGRLIGGVAIALAGVALTLGVPALQAGGAPDARGVVLVLASAALYALYIVSSERSLPGIHSVLALAYIATG